MIRFHLDGNHKSIHIGFRRGRRVILGWNTRHNGPFWGWVGKPKVI